jgi:Peptidase family M50
LLPPCFILRRLRTGLRNIVFNFQQTAEQISGPVAIVAVGAEVARADASGLFQFAAIVNINLAVVNVLPLPALDGGYLLLLVRNCGLTRTGRQAEKRAARQMN